jgi:orotidine-5'-phosphate decarboxylase
LGDTPDGLDRFADIALRAAVGTVGLVKLQSAFYERHGWRGFRTLQRLTAEARSAGLLVIVDAKRGDVGTPMPPMRRRFLGDYAPLAADALTVHPISAWQPWALLQPVPARREAAIWWSPAPQIPKAGAFSRRSTAPVELSQRRCCPVSEN